MNKFFKTISLLSLLFGAQAWAGNGNGNGNDPCAGLSLGTQPAQIDMNTQSDVAQPITVSRTGNGTCNYFIALQNNPAGGTSYNVRYLDHGGSDKISFNIYKSVHTSNQYLYSIVDNPNSSSQVIAGTFSGSATTASYSYYPYVNPSQIFGSGPYLTSYTFVLYQSTTSNPTIPGGYTYVNSDRNVNFKYTVDTSLSISLVDSNVTTFDGTDISQNLDFGTLTPNTSPNSTLGFNAILKYTSGFRLSLSSVNGGKIKNTGAYTSSNTINYSLKVNSISVTFASANTYQEVTNGSGSSPATGTLLPVTVTIPTVGAVYPGTYTDTVYFKISAL